MKAQNLQTIVKELGDKGYNLNYIQLINFEEQAKGQLEFSISRLLLQDKSLQESLIEQVEDNGNFNVTVTPIAASMGFEKEGHSHKIVIGIHSGTMWYLFNGSKDEEIGKAFKKYGWSIKTSETNIENYLY